MLVMFCVTVLSMVVISLVRLFICSMVSPENAVNEVLFSQHVSIVDDNRVMLVNRFDMSVVFLVIFVVLFKMFAQGSGVPASGEPVSGAPIRPVRVVYKVLILVMILLLLRSVWNTSV